MASSTGALSKRHQERKESGLFRELSLKTGLIDFASNDYLGLAQSPELKEQLQKEFQASDLYNGSGAARLLSGNSALAEELEESIAAFHRADAGLLYNSGYTANLGVLSCVPQRGDTILYDEHSHASIRDGARLSFARSYSFRHNDLEDLRRLLKTAKGLCYVVVEGLYSMDGDLAPLVQILKECEQVGAKLIVDEAHTNGLFGEEGRGLCVELGIEKEVFARIFTFGKALGSQGAIVVGSKALKDFLINFSRPFIYTTAAAPYSLLSIKKAYEILPQLNVAREKLFSLVALFASYFPDNSPGAVQKIVVPGNEKARSLSRALAEKGFDVRALLSPTVSKGTERLRICLHSYNSEEELRKLISCLQELHV